LMKAKKRTGKRQVRKAVTRSAKKTSTKPRVGRGRRVAGKAGGRKDAAVKARKALQRKAVKPKAKPVSPRVQRLKAMLESKQTEILKQIKRARADSLDVNHTSFPEVGDLVSASVEKEKAFEYSEAGVNALREIAGALEKLKEGTYGKCERCGKPIGLKRLEAMPSARLCVKCKATEEATSKIALPPADNLFED
jgi:DnaK suppressor protein